MKSNRPVLYVSDCGIVDIKKNLFPRGLRMPLCEALRRMPNVTTRAFYFYFKDKEALFNALVNPAVEELKALFLEVQIHFDELPREERLKESFQYSQEKRQFIKLIFTHSDGFKLLVVHAEGTFMILPKLMCGIHFASFLYHWMAGYTFTL